MAIRKIVTIPEPVLRRKAHKVTDFSKDLQDLIDAAREGNPRITHFDTSCFDGVYVTGDVGQEYLDSVERRRGEASRSELPMNDLASTELHTYY